MASSAMLTAFVTCTGYTFRHYPSSTSVTQSRTQIKDCTHELAGPARMFIIDDKLATFRSRSRSLRIFSNSTLERFGIPAFPGWSRVRGCTFSVHLVHNRRGAKSVAYLEGRKLTLGRGASRQHLDSRFRTRNRRWASLGVRAEQQFLEASGVAKGSTEAPRNVITDELNGSEVGDTSSRDADTKQSPIGVFPGGVRRAEVRIPGLVMRLQVMEVLEGKGLEGFLDILSSVITEGLTMVILESGVNGEGGARLYEAACLLKSVLRGRAALLIAERVDIAAAAGVDGVVLSDEGLPTVVARRMMQSAVSEAAVLPLIARTVSSTQSAKSATALEGADLLLLQCPNLGDISRYVRDVCDEVSIPVFVDVSTRVSRLDDISLDVAGEVLEAGASGLILGGKKWIDGVNVCNFMVALSSVMFEAKKQRSRENETESSHDYLPILCKDATVLQKSSSVNGVGLDVCPDLDEMAKLIVEEERELLTTMVDFVGVASPEMEEISLLVDALKQLDELFLLVIVGEFNSGKSSVINALLGQRFLKEGVLPTTNEITVLRHIGDGNEGEERSEKHPDGHFLRYLPAELLKQMNLVDTPGTNVILQRQQRLTEEFVPRADLVLFVLSVDRPLTESEVTFLRYIRQWGKKIIFILNKSDVLPDRKELEEVVNFVKENAQTLLSVEEASVYPVSARLALLAKQAAKKEDGTFDKELLMEDGSWKSSGFGELENFIFSFLGGSTDAGAERIRLKLETPLGIGMALLGASERQLAADLLKADSDIKVLTRVDEQLSKYQNAVQADASLQRQRTTLMIAGAKGRAEKLVDSILRLSNIDAMLKYLLGADGVKSLPVSSGFYRQVVGSATTDIERVLEEHGSWMVANALRQLDIYLELVKSRWPELSPDPGAGSSNGLQRSDKLKEEQQKNSSNSMAVLQAFDVKAAEILLEQEIREAVLSTFTGVGAAGLSASVLTSVLPTTLEDLVALGVCTAGGFVGIWNLPAKRQDIKRKISRVADNLAMQLEQAMERDLQQNLEQLRADIQALTAPYRQAAEAEKSRVLVLQKQMEVLDKQLRFLKQMVQNLGA